MQSTIQVEWLTMRETLTHVMESHGD